MLKKIISGGQTGADTGGLIAGQKLGLETGGTAPKGYKRETGKWKFIPMQKDNEDKILSGLKTTTVRKENFPDGVYMIQRVPFYLKNRGSMNINQAGGKEVMIVSEAFENGIPKYKQTMDWLDGKGRLFVYDIINYEKYCYNLLKGFGLNEDSSVDYKPRTLKNIRNSDATILFDRQSLKGQGMSAGSKLTKEYCEKESKIILINPVTIEMIRYWLDNNDIKILNIAGNRESVSPGIESNVAHMLFKALSF